MTEPRILMSPLQRYRMGIGVVYAFGTSRGELFFYYDQKPSYSRVDLKTGVVNSFTSKVTGKTARWFEWSQRESALDEARAIMMELEPQAGVFNERDRLLYFDLLQATRVEGLVQPVSNSGVSPIKMDPPLIVWPGYAYGDSLSLTFSTGSGIYELSFQVDIQRPTNPLTFSGVFLKTRHQVSWTSRITNKTDEWFEWSSEEIMWEDARIILRELRHAEIPDALQSTLDEPIHIAKTEGTGFQRDAIGRPVAPWLEEKAIDAE